MQAKRGKLLAKYLKIYWQMGVLSLLYLQFGPFTDEPYYKLHHHFRMVTI